MKALEYGDVVTATSSNGFWQAGQKFYIIAPEGDGDLGLREHAVCFKLGAEGKPAKGLGAYEVPWSEIDFESIQDAATIAIQTKINNLTTEIEAKNKDKKKAEDMYHKVQQNHDVIMNRFAKELE